MSLTANTEPLRAVALAGEVVLTGDGPGRPVDSAFTPEAVLASLKGMSSAAETAILQRESSVVKLFPD